MLTPSDLLQIEQKGIAPTQVERQLAYFEHGMAPLELEAAARIGQGIIRLTDEAVGRYVGYYQSRLGGLRPLKFVPASGAASRMFEALFAFMEGEDQEPQGEVAEVCEQLPKFAFYEELAERVGGVEKLDVLCEARAYKAIMIALLEIDGLDYGSQPKGLLKFHRYADGARTPFEEHLVEAAHYSKGGDGVARLHFTVSAEHHHDFVRLFEKVQNHYSEQYKVRYEVAFSEQKPATDTIAVDLSNQPFRMEGGRLLFRPGGHGALIQNLNELDADLIFIKNIDNVAPDRMKAETFRYKQALAGMLLQLREQVFDWTLRLREGLQDLSEVEAFVQDQLGVHFPQDYSNKNEATKRAWLIGKLDRPMRICGMVQNQGEPGGGPFWVKNKDGSTSLHIVETSQMNLDDPHQQAVLQQATHFNPVDLICSTRDADGRPYNLNSHVDADAAFISQKSRNGRELKALELPGLWNGAMSDWITLFVEVPLATFNPVKKVNDLLREEHQG